MSEIKLQPRPYYISETDSSTFCTYEQQLRCVVLTWMEPKGARLPRVLLTLWCSILYSIYTTHIEILTFWNSLNSLDWMSMISSTVVCIIIFKHWSSLYRMGSPTWHVPSLVLFLSLYRASSLCTAPRLLYCTDNLPVVPGSLNIALQSSFSAAVFGLRIRFSQSAKVTQ